MNVTASNALAVLEEWKALIDRCEFYTVDQEMTGIEGDAPMNKDGLLSEHYANVATGVKRYEAFQYGICLFERNESAPAVASVDNNNNSNKKFGDACGYIVRPFSFWLLKDNANVTLATSAVKFLVSNKMNYQFWLENGFDYGNTDINACPVKDRAFFEETFAAEEQQWVKENFAAINAWYDNPPPPPAAQAAVTPAAPPAEGEAAAAEAPPADEFFLSTYVSARADALLHYLLYAQTEYIPTGQSVPEWIKAGEGRQTPFNAISTKSLLCGARDPRWCRAWFHRLSLEKHSTVDINTRSPVRPKATFHPFFKALIDSKKPHIGHNYFTDLMFQINQHCEAGLPSDYKGFRALVRDTFPAIYDTKVLVSMLKTPPKNTSLGNAFAELSQRAKKYKVAKTFKFPMGFADLTAPSKECAHDGAYDAFMTGVVFLYCVNMSSHMPSSNAVNAAVRANGSRPAPQSTYAALYGPGSPADVEDGIPEGYATYEGVVAQFGAKYWMTLRRGNSADRDDFVETEDDSTNDWVEVRNVIMNLRPPTPPPAAEGEGEEQPETEKARVE